MRLDQLRAIVCAGCGRGDVVLRKLPGAMSSTLRACDACLATHGRAALEREADEALAGATPARRGLGRCLHCGDPTVFLPNGTSPAWCSACDRELMALRGPA